MTSNKTEPMEGWNDCPPLMIPKFNASSSSLRKVSMSNNEENSGLNSGLNSGSNLNSGSSKDDLTPIIDSLCGLNTKLSEKLLNQIKNKLMTNINNMEEYHEFVMNISQQISEKNEITIIKQQIVEFMMINDGVSSWCAALKKLIESIIY